MVEFKNELGDSPHLRENRYGSQDMSSQAQTIQDILAPKDQDVVIQPLGGKDYKSKHGIGTTGDKNHRRLRNRMNMSALGLFTENKLNKEPTGWANTNLDNLMDKPKALKLTKGLIDSEASPDFVTLRSMQRIESPVIVKDPEPLKSKRVK